MVRVRGDEEWIEPCLRSVGVLADEIVLLDNGASADTRAAVGRAREALGTPLRILNCAGEDFVALSNRGLGACRFRWVVRWDADFVAHTDGTYSIRRLRDFLLGLSPRRYFLVEIGAAELAGDLAHQFPDLRRRYDGAAVVWSPAIRYVAIQRSAPVERLATPDRVLRAGGSVRRTLETLQTPRYYRVLRWHDPAYLHVNVKSGRHMLHRHFWLEWLDASSRGAPVSWDEYVARRVEREWGCRDPAAAERRYVSAYCQGLVPYDATRCGPYPALLRPYVESPRYRVEYRDGVITGRSELHSAGGCAPLPHLPPEEHSAGGCAPLPHLPPEECAGEAGARCTISTGDATPAIAYPPAPAGVADRMVAGAALLLRSMRLLDVGCGDGTLCLMVGEEARRCIGVDGAMPALRKAAAQGLAVQCADFNAAHLPYRDGAFDAASCLDVLEHVLDPRHLLRELARVLEPGGVLILTTPNIRYYGFVLTLLRGRFPPTSGDPGGYDGGHLHYFTFADVRSLLGEAGFAAIEEFGLYRWTRLGPGGTLKERVKALLGDHLKREFFSGAVVIRARRAA
jgi:2-polyprenyl-3-methyl-5-hydroxy-6-metoxy-1,4-benzoquinol methylase